MERNSNGWFPMDDGEEINFEKGNLSDWIPLVDKEGNVLPTDLPYPVIPAHLVEFDARNDIFPCDSNDPLTYCGKHSVSVNLFSVIEPKNPQSGESYGRIYAWLKDNPNLYIPICKKKHLKDRHVMLFDMKEFTEQEKADCLTWLYFVYLRAVPANANINSNGVIQKDSLIVFNESDFENISQGKCIDLEMSHFRHPEVGSQVCLDKVYVTENKLVAFAPLRNDPTQFVIVCSRPDFTGVVGQTFHLLNPSKEAELPTIKGHVILGISPKQRRDKSLPHFQNAIQALDMKDWVLMYTDISDTYIAIVCAPLKEEYEIADQTSYPPVIRKKSE